MSHEQLHPPIPDESQLQDMGQRRDPSDIPALLWEIKRLRAVAFRADQLLGNADASGVLRSTLRVELGKLACINIKDLQALSQQRAGRDRM